MAPTLVLHVDRFFVSPYVFSSFVALKEKRLPFELRTVDLPAGEHRRPAYASASLTARIPALQHGDFWLSESSAIAEYLEEAFPQSPRVLPGDLQTRARARQVMAFLRSDLGALRDERSAETIFYRDRALPALTAAGNAAAEKLIGVAGQLVRAPESAFGAWCLADAELAFMLMRLIANGHPVPAPLSAYAQHQWQRPTVREWVDRPREPFVAYV